MKPRPTRPERVLKKKEDQPRGKAEIKKAKDKYKIREKMIQKKFAKKNERVEILLEDSNL